MTFQEWLAKNPGTNSAERIWNEAKVDEREKYAEVLEALEWIANRYDSQKCTHECAADSYDMACVARAAIAKAKGES